MSLRSPFVSIRVKLYLSYFAAAVMVTAATGTYFYFNAHHWLARQLQREGIALRMEDNALVEIADWKRAQAVAESFQVFRGEKKFHALAARFCPVVEKFTHGYHWSVMQVEYALDVVFTKREALAPLYEQLSREAVLTVRVPDLGRFWDKRFSPEARTAATSRRWWKARGSNLCWGGHR